jgi:hypothetical protein
VADAAPRGPLPGGLTPAPRRLHTQSGDRRGLPGGRRHHRPHGRHQPVPAQGSPELETLRQDAIRALEIPDEQALIRAAARGELEARELRGQQAQAAAPEPAHELRAVSLAEAEAKIRAADPDVDESARAEAVSLADILADQRAQLEAAQAGYERWSAETAEDRESAGHATAELQRRQAHNIDEPEVISTPEPETPTIEPEPAPEASPEADVNEPEAAELEF